MLKSKLFAIFLLILVLLNIFTADSFAFNFVYDSTLYDLGDINLYTYTVALLKSDDKILLFSFEQEPVSRVSSNKNYIYFKNNYYYYTYNITTGVLTQNQTYPSDSETFISSDIDNCCIYSNFDIKNSSGEVVFQEPVLTLGEVLVKANPVKMFQTMTSGMITSLVVFLVSLVGFLKAWSLLSNSLRKA